MLSFVRSARLHRQATRTIYTTARLNAAQAFGMPAMSPTMEKGNIVKWKMQVGQTFSSGDILLEVETDKSSIDVEAQDDGKLAKIVVEDGAKDVDVGTTIAFLADVEDDVATLVFPEAKAKAEPKAQAEVQPKSQAESKTQAEVKPKAEPKVQAHGQAGTFAPANPAQTLLPSVLGLLHANHIAPEEALNKIEASGPNGRLLKGDVLAYLGRISKDNISKVTQYIKASEKLDLSNIKLREPVVQKPAEKPAKVAPEPVVYTVERVITEKEFSENPEILDQLELEAKQANFIAHRTTDAFEELIAAPSSVSRFSYELQLGSVFEQQSVQETNDEIFDFLVSDKRTMAKKVDTVVPAFPLKVAVKVTVNDKIPDAKAKAQLFVDEIEAYFEEVGV